MGNRLSKLWKTEDWWAVWLGLGIVIPGLALFASASSVLVAARTPADHLGVARLADTFKSKAGTIEYDADFSFSSYWSQI